MWKIFRRWGKVNDVFISKRVNRRGHKFGFVRFTGVGNEQWLAKQLDNIWIGDQKLHSNLPKYRKMEGNIDRGFT